MKLFGWTVARAARPVLARGTLVGAAGSWPQDYAAQVREGYARNAVAQRAVKLVAQGVAEVPLDAPAAFTDLLRPRGGAPGVLESVAAQLLLHGNAFVQVTADADGARLLYPLRPERVAEDRLSVNRATYLAGAAPAVPLIELREE